MRKKTLYIAGGVVAVLAIAVASASLNGVDDTLRLFDGLLAMGKEVLK